MARILIIEDNPANLELMDYLLRAFGHETHLAMDGEEGIAAASREEVDLIVCDLQIPRIDGFGVAARLRTDPNWNPVPIVAVTAFAMVGDRDKVLARGFDAYISKPITPETFVSQIEGFLPGNSEPAFRSAPQASREPRTLPREATILVVDNSPVNLQLARSTLEPFGYHVLTAGGMTEALSLLRESAPDLILSDVHMPRGSGYDLIKEVKADTTLRDIPFVFISSTVRRDSDRTTGLGLGAIKFILRPIDPAQLLSEIAECLEK